MLQAPWNSFTNSFPIRKARPAHAPRPNWRSPSFFLNQDKASNLTTAISRGLIGGHQDVIAAEVQASAATRASRLLRLRQSAGDPLELQRGAAAQSSADGGIHG